MKKWRMPVPSGGYAVGTSTYTIKDDRPEKLAAGMRSIASRVYYPVLKESAAGLKKARYLSRDMAEKLNMPLVLPVNYDKLEASGNNVSECYENAPPVPGMKFPLIMFSAGYGSYREGNSCLCIELASHGYVVISVSHSLEYMCTEFDDGSKVFYDKSISKKTYDPYLAGTIGAMKISRMKGSPGEIADKFDEFQFRYSRFMVGRLEEWKKDTVSSLDYARKNLSGMIDFDCGVGAAGHSFGGDTAYGLCVDHPDFVCGINMDGALFGDYRNTVLKTPFMQISCGSNEHIVSRVYLHHTKDVYKVLFRGMTHVGFSDMKFQIPIKMMTGSLDPDVLHETLCRCHLEFFDAFLAHRKPAPQLQSSEAAAVTVFPPDTGL